MFKCNKFFLLASSALVVSSAMNLNMAYASSDKVLGTHTTHLPLELKPDLYSQSSFKVAAICALGDNDCGLNIGFDKSDNDTSAGAKKCRNNGFMMKSNCAAPKINGAKCPYHPNYAKPCYCPTSYSQACAAPNYGIGIGCDGKFTSCGCNPTCPTGFQISSVCEFGIATTTKNTCNNGDCYKCKPCSNTCSSGTLSTCNNTQIQVSTTQTQCKNTCYICRAKNCSAYPINGTCPANGVCSTCPDEPTIFKKLDSCNSGFIKSGNKCLNDICPTNFSKTNNCEFGIENTKNTEAGTPCYKCKPCSNTCSSGTLSTCNNTQIQVSTIQTQCKNTCYTCRAKNCSAYPINGACPANGVCSTCPDEPTIFKKLDSCNSGYELKNGKCTTSCIISNCTIGSIMYSDKTCSMNCVNTSKAPIGIVIDTNKKLIAALESTLKYWDNGAGELSDVFYDIPSLPSYKTLSSALTDMDGKNNTAKIIAFQNEKKITHQAADYCYNYNTAGTVKGQWFLPSFGQLKIVYAAKEKEQNNLNLLGINILYGFNWSSSEQKAQSAWFMYTAHHEEMNYYWKNHNAVVRCVTQY